VVADVDQLPDRLVGRREVGGRAEFDFLRVDQRTSDAAARPVRPRAAVPGEHRPEDVVRPRVAYHVRDERVAGDQTHVVRHLRTPQISFAQRDYYRRLGLLGL